MFAENEEFKKFLLQESMDLEQTIEKVRAVGRGG